MKAILAQALYPRVAAPDSNNESRERESDWRFHCREVSRRGVASHVESLRPGPRAGAHRGGALRRDARDPPGVFVQLRQGSGARAVALGVERRVRRVRRTNLSGPVADVTRDTAGGGESLLVAASRLRLATRALLRERLRVSKGSRRRSSNGGRGRGGGVRSDEDVFEGRTRRPRICWRRCAPRPCPRPARLIAERPSRRAAACSAWTLPHPSQAPSRSPWGSTACRATTSRMISPSSSESGRCDTTSRWFPNPRSSVTFRPNTSPSRTESAAALGKQTSAQTTRHRSWA